MISRSHVWTCVAVLALGSLQEPFGFMAMSDRRRFADGAHGCRLVVVGLSVAFPVVWSTCCNIDCENEFDEVSCHDGCDVARHEKDKGTFPWCLPKSCTWTQAMMTQCGDPNCQKARNAVFIQHRRPRRQRPRPRQRCQSRAGGGQLRLRLGQLRSWPRFLQARP